ncbi:MAG: COX15/CtaA family protein [Halolamina sp.]
MNFGRPSWLPFRRFAALTTGLTLSLVVLGIYTAGGAYGAGCGAYWLTCNGNLFPQTFPAFIEWLHRFVAMITGWLILGTALWAWRSDHDRATTAAALIAAGLLPVQVTLGAVTLQVYSTGTGIPAFVARNWATLIFASHYLTATSIFVGLVVATTLAYRGHYDRAVASRVRLAVGGSLAAMVPAAALSRAVPGVSYTPITQVAFYLVAFGTLGAVLAAWLWTGRLSAPRLRVAVAGGGLALFVHLLLGLSFVSYTAAVRTVDLGATVVAAGFLGVAALLARRVDTEARAPGVAGD